MDSGWVVDDNSPATFTDGTAIRRLYLNASGNFPEGWGYVVMGGLSGDVVRMQDAYLRHYAENHIEIRLGQHRRHVGLESESSNTNLIFLERSGMINAFRPRRGIGISAYPHGDGWGGSFGLFNGNLGGQNPGSDGVALDTRFFVYPLDHLHLGANFSLTTLNETQQRFAARAESFRPEESFINTGLVRNLSGYATSGLEATYQGKNWTVMGEWQHQDLERDVEPHAAFSGGYLTAHYSLTGEMRTMDKRVGGYGALMPRHPVSKGGIGAWEMALRRSYLDMSDADIRGGRLDSTTLGLNWHPERNLKLMLNYGWHQTDAESRFPSADPQFVLMRMQITY